jgi:hypothetical protein
VQLHTVVVAQPSHEIAGGGVESPLMQENEAHHIPLWGLRPLMLLRSVLAVSCPLATSPWRVCASILVRYHDPTSRYSTMVGAKAENECEGGGSKWE